MEVGQSFRNPIHTSSKSHLPSLQLSRSQAFGLSQVSYLLLIIGETAGTNLEASLPPPEKQL